MLGRMTFKCSYRSSRRQKLNFVKLIAFVCAALLLMLCFYGWVTDLFSPKKEWVKHAKNSIHVCLCLEFHNAHSFKFGSRNTRFQSSKYVRQKCKQLSLDLYGFSVIISLFSYSQITSVTHTFFLINIGIVNGKKMYNTSAKCFPEDTHLSKPLLLQ